MASEAPHGGRILKQTPRPFDEGWETVLAYLSHNKITPFVTWQHAPQTNEFVWGHYFKTSTEATVDYKKRVRESFKGDD